MATEPSHDISMLLGRIARGDHEAEERLLPLVYQSLRQLASRELRGERAGHTLDTTALAHEAWLKVARGLECDWRDRAHFYAVSVAAMRRVLVDHARRRRAAKRGGASVRVPLQEDLSDKRADPVDLIDLHDALLDLARVDARQARVSELRLLGGLSVEEVAHVLGVSPRTVKGDWRSACAWLRPRLSRDKP